MVWPLNPLLLRLVLLGALAATTALAGCGRKGPLEPPPSAQATPRGAEETGRAEPAMTDAGRPVAPPGEKKRIPLDWLID